MRIYVNYEDEVVKEETRTYGQGDFDYTWERKYKSDIVSVTNKRISGKYESFDAPNKTKIVYVVYVIYGDGDTFGHSNGEINIDSVWSKRKEADDRIKEINLSLKKRREGVVPDYSDFKPYMGYFATVEDIAVKRFDITKEV